MASRITCQVHDGAQVTVVRLAGTLDMISMREVYARLEECLARQPDALVVDLAELAVRDQLAVSVFAAVARRAADWPMVPLVLCAPHPEAAALLTASTACRVVPMRDSCDEASRFAGASAVSRLRLRLDPVAAACRRARELVTDACARWNLPEAAGPASVVLSELVGNVVRHAGTPMQVTVTLRRPWLHLAVIDGSSAAARPGAAGQHDEGGRGLLLVRELADRWGSAPAGDGKAVWATLPAN
ncbi:ATP-binding protein [Verrucosispora sp. WMMD1129]|uniref:ATP-binding protein n=1 Tax=Verrucosispora sp. WMMD1129 TaxID=3016093 RepID=UPI00249B51F4|nr:ATP-binding protein [Verrucosispora sp. WMMD1129]WFE43296.1 ATP-binding protein [Verrucosispora sp. WMMD1129]